MTSIIGIPTTRVSNSFIQQRLLAQVQYDQVELFRLQTQLSTGRRFELPSEDSVASMRIIDLQRLIERKKQIYGNVDTNMSYLTATDTTLSEISGMLADVRGTALGVLGTTATDVQRQAAAQQVDQAIKQLFDTGNQQFRGRYLFAGSATQVAPFEMTASGCIEYNGNDESIQSYADLNLLFKTNLSGEEVFGAVSTMVEGAADLDPVVKFDTRLADLYGGDGVNLGSICIGDGSSTKVVDLSTAETVGDVAQILAANPPAGNRLEVEITPQGFRVRLGSGNLTIYDVGSSTTAQELGIVETLGAGTDFVDSRDLDPILRNTTRLDDVFGAKAQTVIHSLGADNDIIIRAAVAGEDYNGFSVSFTDTAVAGSETVTFSEGSKTIVIGIEAGESTAADVVRAINTANGGNHCPFTAELDPIEEIDDGEGLVALSATGTTEFGAGKVFDKSHGLQIVNGGNTYNLSFASAETVEDMLNVLNGADAGLSAGINDDKTGIDIRSRISGADFCIGENGGATADDLGVRTFTADVPLDNLNFGSGVNSYEGVDFSITRADGVVLEIDIDTAVKLQDVINLINGNAENADGALTARLAAQGNGIELVDESRGSGSLTVTRATLSTAAIDLGLIPEGEDTAAARTSNAVASKTLTLAGANNDLSFVARFPGTYGNVNIIFQDTGLGADSCDYDDDANTLTFEITNGTTTANDIIDLLEGDAEADALFTASLSVTNDPGNTGAGAVPPTSTSITNGRAEILTGSDCNPQETEGILTALLRLRDALLANDVQEAQRTIDMFDGAVTDLTFSRAELGARQQSLEILQSRLETEEIELKETLSTEYDVDIAEVISNLTARQLAYEASLQAMGGISQLSLLDYL